MERFRFRPRLLPTLAVRVCSSHLLHEQNALYIEVATGQNVNDSIDVDMYLHAKSI